MRAIAVSQTTFRKWVALLALLIFGSLAYWVPAHADTRTGVPTKQTPAPQAAPAPKPVKKDPPARTKTPPKSVLVCSTPRFSNALDAGTYQWQSGVRIEGCCCENAVDVRSFVFGIDSTIKSSGYAAEQCELVPSNQ